MFSRVIKTRKHYLGEMWTWDGKHIAEWVSQPACYYLRWRKALVFKLHKRYMVEVSRLSHARVRGWFRYYVFIDILRRTDSWFPKIKFESYWIEEDVITEDVDDVSETSQSNVDESKDRE